MYTQYVIYTYTCTHTQTYVIYTYTCTHTHTTHTPNAEASSERKRKLSASSRYAAYISCSSTSGSMRCLVRTTSTSESCIHLNVHCKYHNTYATFAPLSHLVLFRIPRWCMHMYTHIYRHMYVYVCMYMYVYVCIYISGFSAYHFNICVLYMYMYVFFVITTIFV